MTRTSGMGNIQRGGIAVSPYSYPFLFTKTQKAL